MEENGGQIWIDEAEHEEHQRDAAAAAADTEGQNEILSEFCRLHPQHFPSQANGDLLAEEYLAAFVEANPGIRPFWDLAALETVYDALVAQNAFEVERVFKQ